MRERSDRGHELAMALRCAYWAMHRQADACLLPLGVTANQFVLLSLLAEEDGVTQADLVDRASSDANTVRAMLVTLERKGLVERRPHASDGRARSVTLSRKGRDVQESLWTRSESFRERLERALDPGEIERLIGGLSRLRTAMDPETRRPTRSSAGGATSPPTTTRKGDER